MSRINGHAPDTVTIPAKLAEFYAAAFGAMAPMPVASHHVNNGKVSVPKVNADGSVSAQITPVVELWTFSLTGPNLCRLTPRQAEELADLLTRYAVAARTGLVLDGS